MSQETSIGNLSGGISDEDSRLVDSILNDINNSGDPRAQTPQQGSQQGPQQGGPQQGGPQQGSQQGPQQGPQQGQPSPEQIKMMQQQQMAMRQQQMAQQQMAQQQMAQQQMNQQKQNIIQGESENNIMENIKVEAKNIMTVILLCIIFNIEQVDSIFKAQAMFITESGSLNMQAVFVKALLVGIILCC